MRYNSTIKDRMGICPNSTTGTVQILVNKVCIRCNEGRKREAKAAKNASAPSMRAVKPQVRCADKGGKKIAPRKARKQIAPVSRQGAKKMRAYSALRKIWMEQHPVCQFRDCACKATEVHHKAGRLGELLLDSTKWMAVCRYHHCWIETHPDEAKALNYSLNRVAINHPTT